MAVRLAELLEKTEYQLIQGNLDTEVSDLAYDSRRVAPGMLFVALAGFVVDGHKFIPDVIRRGASVIVVERETEIPDQDVTVIRVANGREALSRMSQAYFGYPAERMISIGITGTKGKSTTAYMVRDIIEKSGRTCGIVGTIGIYIKGTVTPTEHTTPESYDLQKAFADMVEAGCDYMVMEGQEIQEEEMPEIPQPSFLQEEQEMGSTARGTLYHLVMEHFPYRQIGAEDWTEAEFQAFLVQMVQKGYMGEEESCLLDVRKFVRFVHTDIGQRMLAAELDGRLRREQPFMMGCERNI